jgi:hypothetical protein
MFIYNCKFCGEVEIKSSKHAGSHVTNCLKNPNRGKSFEKLKVAGKTNSIEKRNDAIIKYNKNPKKCKNCELPISYDKKNNNYCGHSCSASYTNKNRKTKKYQLSEKGLESLKLSAEKRRKKLIEFYKKNPEKKKQIIKNLIEKNTKTRVEFICPVCGKILMVTENEFKKRKYCGGSCRNKINNKQIFGTRSKAEVYLEETLKNEFPNLIMMFNDRELLNGKELDVYIPSLNLAIEWNGIYHYKKIRDDESFEKTTNKDKQKISDCVKLNIELYVVKDLTSGKKFIKEETKKIIKFVKQKIRTGSSVGRAQD